MKENNQLALLKSEVEKYLNPAARPSWWKESYSTPEMQNYYKKYFQEPPKDSAEKQVRFLFLRERLAEEEEALKSSQNRRRLESIKVEWEKNKNGDERGYRSYFFLDLLGRPEEGNESRQQLLDLPVDEKLDLIHKIQDKLRGKISKIENISKEMIRSGQIKFKNEADQRFFDLLIETYYSNMPQEMVNNILKSLIERPDKDSALDIFKIMVLHSGPQIQKLFQVLGRRDGFSSELQDIFKKVEDSGLETPWESISKRFLTPPEGFEWVELSRKPMVGTMAQTYKGKVKDRQGKIVEIAARTLKNGIMISLKNEDQKLLKLAEVIDQDPILRQNDFPLLGPILNDVKEMANEEVDILRTNQNQQIGKTKYQSSIQTSGGTRIDFVVPETLPFPDSQSLISTWITGEKFDDFQKQNPSLAETVAEEIARKWLETALFSGLFFHTDLHQGNFKIQKLSQNHVQVGLLDFGMIGTFSEEERVIIGKLAVASKSVKNSFLIANYIWDLSDSSKNQISKEELILAVQKKLNEASPNVSDWLEWSLSKGIKLKKEISAFSRGLAAISQLLEAGKSQVTITTLIQEVAKKYKWVSAKTITGVIKDRLFVRRSDQTNEIKEPILPLKCSHIFSK
ncbi:MAG: AarF/UbiB family protein [Pseudobdellovibrionaceae bacterium]